LRRKCPLLTQSGHQPQRAVSGIATNKTGSLTPARARAAASMTTDQHFEKGDGTADALMILEALARAFQPAR